MTICYRGRAGLLSVVLGIQDAKRMRHVILSVVVCLALPYCSTVSHKRHIFQKIVIEHEMYVLIFSTPFVCNIFAHCLINGTI